MHELHSLLIRQLRRYAGPQDPQAEQPSDLLQAISAAYRQFDADRELLEHSMELTSQELIEANTALQRANQDLESRVAERTTDLNRVNDQLYLQLAERREAEDRIRQYADIVHNMKIGLYVLHMQDLEDDHSLKLISANPAALEYSGTTEEEVLGKTLDESFPDLREMGIPQKYAEVIHTQKAMEFEVSYRDAAQQLETAYAVKAFPLPRDHVGVAFESITERKRAELELKHRADEFSTLYEITKDLSFELDLAKLLESIVHRTNVLLDSSGGFIYLYDRTNNDLVLTYSTAPVALNGIHLQMGEGMAGKVALTRQPLIVDDYQKWDGRAEVFDDRRLRSVVEVPMLYGGDLVGVLGVENYEDHARAFNEKDTYLLSLFAGYAAIAVRNVHLLTETNTHARNLTLLYEAGLTLNRELDPQSQIRSFFEIVKRGMRAEDAVFFRYSEDARELHPEFGVGPELDLDTFKELRFPLGEELGLVGMIAETRKPLYLPDAQKDPRWIKVGPALRSVIWVPVEYENRLLGVITVASKDVDAFSKQDEQLLVLFANQLSIAMENARLFDLAARELLERKQAEDEIRRSHSLLNTTLESTADGILVVNLEGGVSGYNRKFLELWKIPEELASRQDDRLMLDHVVNQLKSPLEFMAGVDALYRSPESVSFDELEFADGRVFERYSQPQRAGDEILGRVWSFRDVTERKQAEWSLRKSEARFRNLFENSPLAIWEEDFSQVKATLDELMQKGVTDLNNLLEAHPEMVSECLQRVRVLDVNQAALKLYEAETKSDLLGFLDKTLPEEALQGFKNELLLIARGGREYHSESIVNTLQGARRIVSVHWTVAPGSEQDYSRVLVSLIDMTEQKQAEEKLRESEGRFRSLIENSSDEISLLAADGSLLYESPTSNPTLGYASGEFLGKDIFQLVHPDELVRVQGLFSRLVEKPGSSLRDQFRLRHRSGGWRWVEAVGTNLLEEPAIRAIVVNYHDITERREAGEKLRESEEKYRLLFENNPLPMWIYDLESLKFLRVNDAAIQQYGYSKDEFMAMTIREIRPSNEIPRLLENVAHVTEGRDEAGIWAHQKKDGSLVEVEIVSHTVEFDGRRAELVLANDVTQRRRAEQALRENEQRYRALFENSPVSIWEEDFSQVKAYFDELRAGGVVDFREHFERHPEAVVECIRRVQVLDVNRTTLELMKVADKSELLTTLAESLNEDAIPILAEEMISLAEGNLSYASDEIFTSRTGEKRDVFFKLTVAPGYEETLGRVFVSIVDITERKQAEQALEAAENKYRNLVERLPVVVYTSELGIEGRWMYVSPHIEELLGFTAAEWLEDSTLWHRHIHPEDRERQAALEEQSWLGREPFDSEYRMFTRGGREVWIRDIAQIIPPQNGGLPLVQGTLMDVSARKLAEAELRKNEERLQLFFSQSLDGFFFSMLDEPVEWNDTADKDSIIEYVLAHQHITEANDAMLKQYGVERADLIGRTPAEFFAHDLDQARRFRRALFDAGHLHLETEERTEEGAPLWVEGDYVCMRDSQGRITGMFGIQRDITERKQAEARLRKSEERYHALFEDSPLSIWEEDFSDLKKHLDELQAQGHTDLREYFSTHPEAIDACSSLIRIMDVNKAALQMYRAVSKAELIEESQQVMSKGERENIIADFIAIAEGRLSNAWEGEDETLKGDSIEVSLNWLVVPGHEADYSKVIVTVVDITERKRAERELQSSEERFRLLAGNIHEVFWITDPLDGKDLYISPAYEEVWGRKPEEQLQDQKVFMETVVPEDRMMVREMIQKQVRGNTTEMEYRILRADGTTRWIWDRAFPILDEDGSVKLITGVAADITERKQAEAETLRHLDEIRALYENGLAVARLLSPREIGNRLIQTITHYLAWHHVTIRLRKGQSDDLELIAFSVPDLMESESRNAENNFNTRVQKVGQGLSGWVVLTGETVRTGNVRAYPQYVDTYKAINSGMYIPLKVGDQVIGSLSVESELPDAFTVDDERLLATLSTQAAVAFENARLYQAVQQELGERRHAEEMLAQERNSLANRVEERTSELISANSNLARALRFKDEFLANMSHELRTPLNAILGLSESLGEQVAGPLNEKQKKYLQTITESGHHLLALINDILDLAKIEAGQVTLDISRVDVHMLCQSSLRMVKQQALKKEQHVSLEIDEKFGLIWADERRLKQMIVNLLSNAVKFTPEKGRIGLEIRGDQEENRVLITVWDTGIGISESQIPQLFQPFVQLSTGLARESTGTGLGLALVAQMARLHGGGVSISSKPGEGSRFTLVLPWEPALAPDTMERMKTTGKFRAVKLTGNQPRRSILLIEDTADVGMMVGDYLEAAGYNVFIASDGAEGLSEAKRIHPDLILMDLQMPRMDGFEATRELRNDPAFKNTPIIALTALAMQGDRERCLEVGMDEYITKPVNLKALVKIIDRCLQPVP